MHIASAVAPDPQINRYCQAFGKIGTKQDHVKTDN